MADTLLPPEFSDLEPLVEDWCLDSEPERYAKRLGSTMDEIQAFYDAVMPRAEDAIRLPGEVPAGRPSRRCVPAAQAPVLAHPDVVSRRDLAAALHPGHRHGPVRAQDRAGSVSHDPQRIADLVEIHQLCARYMAYASQFVVGPVARGLHARRGVQRLRHGVHDRADAGAARGGAAGPVHRQHARGRVRWRPRHRACSTSSSSTRRPTPCAWPGTSDEYVRTPDGWRIRRRSTTFLRKHGGVDSGRQHDPLAESGD